MGPKRDWGDARAKVEGEGQCRVCGSSRSVEAAHILGRKHDEPKVGADGRPLKELYVDPIRVIPLCGPFPEGCHGKDHKHELDLLPYLTAGEQAQAVLDAGSMGLALKRISPMLEMVA